MASNDWNPKTMASRPAGSTENIHRVIAWIYGAIGALMLAVFLLSGHPEWGVLALIVAIFGTLCGPHAALAAGARRRSGLARPAR